VGSEFASANEIVIEQGFKVLGDSVELVLLRGQQVLLLDNIKQRNQFVFGFLYFGGYEICMKVERVVTIPKARINL